MLMKMSRERGRPRDMYHNRGDFSSLEYMALISIKYRIDSKVFFDSFVRAWDGHVSICESLSIDCRKKTPDYAVFLITKGFKVVAQFSLSTNILQKINPLKEFVGMMPLKKMHSEEKIVQPQIRDLKVGMKQINLKVNVIEIPKPYTVFTRLGQAKTVSNIKVTDETGIIQLPLWNQQIHTVTLGDTILVENAHVVTFRGEPQLRVGRKGQLSVIKKNEDQKQIHEEERI
jgi:hypothetical protein